MTRKGHKFTLFIGFPITNSKFLLQKMYTGMVNGKNGE